MFRPGIKLLKPGNRYDMDYKLVQIAHCLNKDNTKLLTDVIQVNVSFDFLVDYGLTVSKTTVQSEDHVLASSLLGVVSVPLFCSRLLLCNEDNYNTLYTLPS